MLTSEKRKNVACAVWDVPTAETVEVIVVVVAIAIAIVVGVIKSYIEKDL